MRGDRRILGLLGFLTFAAVYVNIVVSPVLAQLAREFDLSLGTAGLAVAAYGVPGIVVAILAGPISDRYGRKRFLVGGSLVMGLFTALGAAAPSFAALIVARVLAGTGSFLVFPNVNATIGDTFPYRERGRAVSTVIGLNTLATIVGVPLAGIVAEATSWRVSLLFVGLLAVGAALTLALALPGDRRHGDVESARTLYRRIFGSSSAIALILSSMMGALYWFTWTTYSVVFFEDRFGLSQGFASTVALTTGLGVLFGSQAGGRLGDRIGHRRIVASTIVASSLVLLALTNLPLPLVVAAALNLALSTVIGARFATNSALLTEQVPEARGTMLSVSSSVQSVAIVIAATIGGQLIDTFGYWSLGVFCSVVALASAFTVLTFVREEPIDLDTQPA